MTDRPDVGLNHPHCQISFRNLAWRSSTLSRVDRSSTCPCLSRAMSSHRLPKPCARSQNTLLRSIGVVLSASPCMMSVGTRLLVKVCMGDKDEGFPCPFIRSRNNPSETASTTGETSSNASGPPLPELSAAASQPTVAADATSRRCRCHELSTRRNSPECNPGRRNAKLAGVLSHERERVANV